MTLKRGLDFCPRRASDSGFQNLASVTCLQMSFLIVSDRDAQHLLALSREGLGRAEPLEHRQMSTNEKLEILKSLNNGVCTQGEARVWPQQDPSPHGLGTKAATEAEGQLHSTF